MYCVFYAKLINNRERGVNLRIFDVVALYPAFLKSYSNELSELLQTKLEFLSFPQKSKEHK